MRRIFLASMLLLITGTAHAAGPATPQPTAHSLVPTGLYGFLPVVRNSAQPVACSARLDGAIALTRAYTLCVCRGDAAKPAWVKQVNPTTACDWLDAAYWQVVTGMKPRTAASKPAPAEPRP